LQALTSSAAAPDPVYNSFLTFFIPLETYSFIEWSIPFD